VANPFSIRRCVLAVLCSPFFARRSALDVLCSSFGLFVCSFVRSFVRSVCALLSSWPFVLCSTFSLGRVMVDGKSGVERGDAATVLEYDTILWWRGSGIIGVAGGLVSVVRSGRSIWPSCSALSFCLLVFVACVSACLSVSVLTHCTFVSALLFG